MAADHELAARDGAGAAATYLEVVTSTGRCEDFDKEEEVRPQVKEAMESAKRS